MINDVKIDYGVIDQTITSDSINDEYSSEMEYSDIVGTVNSDVKDRIAYAEKDYFLLDGSFSFPSAGIEYNTGWESLNLSDASGNIDEYIEYMFGSVHTSYGIAVIFPRGCEARNFEITYYNGDNIVKTENVINNTAKKYSLYTFAENWDKVRIHFIKINPLQRARINNIIFGVNFNFDKNAIIAVSANRKISPLSDYTECGEFSFTIFNNGLFNVKDITDMPIGLQEGLSVSIFVKENEETTFKPFAQYYTNGLQIDDNGTMITISGYDLLYDLNRTNYTRGVVNLAGVTLKSIAEDIADSAGITLNFDPNLPVKTTQGYITEVSHREALRLICEAWGAVLVIDSDGEIWIRPINFLGEEETVDFDEDEVVEESNKKTQDNKYLGVSVSKYTYALGANNPSLAYVEEIAVTEELQEIEVVYSDYPAVPSSIKVYVNSSNILVCTENGAPLPGSMSYENIPTAYSDRVVLYIKTRSGSGTLNTFITVSGQPYITVVNAVTVGSIAKNIKEITNNFLLTGTLAEDVAQLQYRLAVAQYDFSAEILTEDEYELGQHCNIADEDDIYISSKGFSMSSDEYSEEIGGLNWKN